ncbi:MAG: GTP-binding protein, partial [Pseudodonghicola sp.]
MSIFVTPITILAGFLGAGKTTLLNRFLGEHHGKRFVVIENEFGEVAVDGDLVLQHAVETVVQLDNGCLCCTVRGDLAGALGDLAARKARGEIAFDHVLIECSGLADPGPVIQTFLAETELLAHFALDGILTLADARSLPEALAQSVEATAQIALADRVLLSKADLVTPEVLAARRALIGGINVGAPVIALDIPAADWGTLFEALLEIRGYEMDRLPESPAPVAAAGQGHHTHGISSVGFTAGTGFDMARLQTAFAAIKQRHGDRIWRLKGVLDIAGMRKRVVVQGVQEFLQVNEGR